jgi:SpoVK/Ycf46/Vps4 family AAA+-type ATPase
LIKADGRVMVDGSSFQRLNPNYGVFSNSPSNDAILPQLADDLLHLTYPTLGGFSFTAKKWGEIDLNKLEEIVYDDDAFDRLVLPNEKKKLIRSLVENTQTSFSDIISGKGGGCIFLLHGSPGVGKTLTAEAIAELLHRPLYSVSVGELGTNTDELEKKLREILELASTWNAVILIDEADIFLERRSENDIVRNAMVGIFLRLLEYHQGVLFLTTNRVRCFDEAFHSRISVALKYDDLDRKAREQIWINLLNAAKISGLDATSLSEFVINGRQIRTTIRLAQSLANSEGATVTRDHVMATITVAQQFVNDLMNENNPQTTV